MTLSPRPMAWPLKPPGVGQRLLFTPPPPITACTPREEPERPQDPNPGQPTRRRGAGERGAGSRPRHSRPADTRPGSKPSTSPRDRARRAQQRPVRPSRPDLELPRHWSVEFEVLDGANAGKVKLTSAQARGWSKVIRPFPDAVKEAITEARLYVAEQGQANWHGTRTELDVLTAHDDPDEPPPPRVADVAQLQARAELRWTQGWSKECEVRPDQAGLEQWSLLPGDRWLSPNGREWAAAPKGLLRKRRDAGLPTTYDEQCRVAGMATVSPLRRGMG